MSQKYAKDQPAGFTNRIEKVAIVGAGGRIGGHFAEALLKTGKHTVTALMRPDSKSTPPSGVKIIHVDYDDEESLISALRGHQFLVITLFAFAPPETHSKINKAAAKAGIPYIMPNDYGSDPTNKSLREENFHSLSLKASAEIVDLGVSACVTLVCGFWYEWSVALGEQCFGLDAKNRKATFFDDGKTPLTVSTWQQCGRALAGLLSLKELPDDENDNSTTISHWRNKPLYIASFTVTQRDMLDSIHRLTGTTDADWEIRYEETKERYKKAVEDMQKGDRTGFAKAMYTRTFYPNGDGDHEAKKGLDNELIGIEKEELDGATKRALDMVASGWNPWAT